MSKVIKITIGIFVVAVIGIVAAISTLDVNQYKGELIEAVEQVTGRELQIGSNLQFALSFIPTVVIEDVKFSNTSWGSKPEMLSLNKFEIEVALLPLLSGNIQINRVILLEPDILFETNKKGLGNWIFASKEVEETVSPAPESDASLPAIVIKEVRIENAKVHYKDGVTGQETKLTIENIELKSDDDNDPLSLIMKVVYNEIPVEINGTIGRLKKLTTNDNYPLDLMINVGDADIGLKGMVAQPMDATGLDIDLSFSVDSLSKLSKLTGNDLPKLGPVNFTGKITDSKQAYSINTIKLLLGKTDLSGDLTINISSNLPAITANLNSNVIDLIELGGGEDKTTKKDSKNRLFSSDPLPLASLKSVNANVTINAKQIKTSSLVLDKTKIVVALKNGNLSIRPLSTLLAGGSLNGNISLDTSGKTAILVTDIAIKKLEPSQFGDLKSRISGVTTDVSIKLKGTGNSVSQIMAGLNGKLLIKSSDGVVKGSGISAANTSLLAMLNPTIKSNTETQVECIVVNFDIKNGIATADKGIALATDQMSVVGSGTIDLKTEKLNIHIKPHARKGVGLSASQLAGMVKLGGTLANPKPSVDAIATLTTGLSATTAVATGGLSLLAQGLLNRTTADTNPCSTALGQKPATTTNTKEKESSSTDKVENNTPEKEDKVMDRLKGLFR
ncbi:MAG: hypothetical protein DRQ40_07150 [Gammaproteobacteria bacterium]|nr:MAG: hypothetical protein DRQ40_07150 [Gammaproteobacteria bacterium]RKZ97324.1 MAG: hypothetical protein DRQ46_05270 [Gammaproteobacteria bacterium]RLA01784.1 MAG: hypothetical protein DRQ42_02360 [Gammaproteobacteria bacterium]